MAVQDDIEQGYYLLQSGIAIQNSTSLLNLHQGTSYDLMPCEFKLSLQGQPTLICGIKHTSQSQNLMAGISAVQDASGNIRLCVNTRSQDALTPAAPTAVSVGVASGALVAASTTRRHLIIVNTDAAARISLGFGANAAVLDSGITIYPHGSYEMSEQEGNLYRGAINAISSAAATNVSIQQDA